VRENVTTKWSARTFGKWIIFGENVLRSRDIPVPTFPNAGREGQKCPSSLCQNLLNDMTVDIREAEVAALEAVGETRMIDS